MDIASHGMHEIAPARHPLSSSLFHSYSSTFRTPSLHEPHGPFTVPIPFFQIVPSIFGNSFVFLSFLCRSVTYKSRIFQTVAVPPLIPAALVSCVSRTHPGSSQFWEEPGPKASVRLFGERYWVLSSPDWGSSILRVVAEWRQWRGGKWRVSDGRAGGSSWTMTNSWISQLKSSTSFLYSCLSWIKWDNVRVSGSWTFWFGNHNCCSEDDREPTKPRKRAPVGRMCFFLKKKFGPHATFRPLTRDTTRMM